MKRCSTLFPVFEALTDMTNTEQIPSLKTRMMFERE
jgi:hypothetical protein